MGLKPCFGPTSVPRAPGDGTREPKEWQVGIGSESVTLALGLQTLYSTLVMTGKGTSVIVEGSADYAGQRKQLAVKIYWPEAHRPKENMLIELARRVGQGDSDITNHLPTVFASAESCSTSRIRRAVGLGTGKPRFLRVIAFASLEPITELPGQDFVRAWLDCVRCGCH